MKFSLKDEKTNKLNEKYKTSIAENEIWEKTALTRNKGHVLGVQMFANKIGYDFSNHDADKFGEFYIPYIFISMSHNQDFRSDIEARKKADPELDLFIRSALFTHLSTNKHHPEAWDTNFAMAIDKDKENKRVIDARKMSDESILEMCCDWASVGAEKGNSPQSWFELKKDKWLFSEEQKQLIRETLEKIWPGGDLETSEIKHNERYFNNAVWSQLNKIWSEYENKKLARKKQIFEDMRKVSTDKKLFDEYSNLLIEEFGFGEFENTVRGLARERENVNNIVGKLNSSNYEPSVTLQGVGSLQSLSFLFSPTVTNYLMNMLDSVINNNYTGVADSKTLQSMNLDKIELGDKYSTKSTITNNFLNGIKKSINAVNSSKLNNKLLLFSKFMNNLKNHARTITSKLEKEQYIKDADSLIKVLGVVKNIITNRNSFINVLNKTLLLRESNEEIISERFLNIYEGI
jgi:hypothetical protein